MQYPTSHLYFVSIYTNDSWHIPYYLITKSMRALWLVNQIWFIVPVNSRKNHASSDLLYNSNRPQVSMAYSRLINHLVGMFVEHEKIINHETIEGVWFTNSTSVILVQYSDKFMHSIVLYSIVLRRSQLCCIVNLLLCGYNTMLCINLSEYWTTRTVSLTVWPILDQLTDRQTDRQVDWLIGWLIDSLIYWFIDSLIRWFIESLIHWVIESLSHWVIWVIESLSHWVCFQQQEAPRFLAHFKGKFIIHKVMK